MLHINPGECLMDEYIAITINKLQPAQHITLRCEVTEGNYVFDSHAHFVSSLKGVVDVTNDGSFGGSYKGISQMGIFWSMIPAEGQINGLRYFPRNCMEPIKFKMQVYDGHLGEESFQKSALLLNRNTDNVVLPVAEDIVLRKCNAAGVTRHEVRYGRVRGTIFKPPGPGPFKGVIDIYGGAGGINESRVALLASHGYIAFTLPHHNYADLVKTMNEVEIEYFLEAIKYFSSLKTVQPNLGILAVCHGAMVGLFLSTICPEVSALITFGATYFLYPGYTYQGNRFSDEDFFKIVGPLMSTISTDRHGGLYFKDYIDHIPIDDFAIKIEQTNAKILLVAGTDDKSTISAVGSGKCLIDRMICHGKGNQISMLCYPGVGHFVDPPFMPQTLVQYHPEIEKCVAIGGELVESSSANVHCWKQILSFLHYNVGLASKL